MFQGDYNQIDLAAMSFSFRDPFTWNDMTSLAEPTYFPPTKIAGTEGLQPSC